MKGLAKSLDQQIVMGRSCGVVIDARIFTVGIVAYKTVLDAYKGMYHLPYVLI